MQRRSGETAGWSALRVGPGGVPPDQVRPSGAPAGSPAGASPAAALPGLPPSGSAPPPGTDPPTVPMAVLGSFDDGRPRRRAIAALIVLAVVAGIVVVASLWSDRTPRAPSEVDLARGDCLSSAGGTTVIGLDCMAPEAEFVVVARFDDSTDQVRCAQVGPDVVLVTRGDVVLCLNYVARVGDCLYAGDTEAVGKAPCRTPGSASTREGLFRVVAVLRDTTSTRDCPLGTLETLVHRDSREVVCLGMP